MSILVKDVELDGGPTQIYIEGGRIVEIGKRREADTVLEAKGKVVLPGLVNLHTHASMTLSLDLWVLRSQMSSCFLSPLPK